MLRGRAIFACLVACGLCALLFVDLAPTPVQPLAPLAHSEGDSGASHGRLEFTTWIDGRAAVTSLLGPLNYTTPDSAAPSIDPGAPRSAFPLPWRWHATRCLEASRVDYDLLATRLGVLPELARLSAPRGSCGSLARCVKSWLSGHPQPFDRNRLTGCTVASRGVWQTPFSSGAFATLAAASYPELRRRIASLAGSSAATPGGVDDLMARIAARGARRKWRVADRQIATLLVLALSRMPPVTVPVFDVTGSLTNQSVVRLYVPGNSFMRSCLAKFVALMRGMPQHYDRGTHTIVRYVFTSHGDYYLNAVALGPLEAEVPIRLAHGADEKVFFEVVYEFFWGDKACSAKKPPAIPLLVPKSPRSMSAVLMRSMFIGTMNQRSDVELRRCAREYVPMLYRMLVPRGGLLVQQLTPDQQLRHQIDAPTRLHAYERDYLDPLRRSQNRAPATKYFMTAPAAWDVQLTDLRGHSACIVLNHFPDQPTHFNYPWHSRNCEDRLAAQSWWIFALSVLLR